MKVSLTIYNTPNKTQTLRPGKRFAMTISMCKPNIQEVNK